MAHSVQYCQYSLHIVM